MTKPYTFDDQLTMDGLEPVTYTSLLTAGNVALVVPNALQLPVTFKEQAASGGRYTSMDAIWSLRLVDLGAIKPKPADFLTDAGGTVWTVLDVNTSKFAGFCRLTCRDLVITFGLQDTINIQRPAITFDGSGVAVRTWPPAGGTTPYLNLACRVQPVAAEIAEERALRGFKITHQVFVSQQVVLQPDDRISIASSAVLAANALMQIRGYHNPYRIDELPVIDADLVP